MKTNSRLERNRKIIVFLTTPIKNGDGKPLLNNKGQQVYPTNREAGEKFDLDKFTISKIKNSMLNYYKEMMGEQQ